LRFHDGWHQFGQHVSNLANDERHYHANATSCHAIVFISSYKAYLDLLTSLLDRLLVLGLDILDTTDHVESRLGDGVVLTVKDLLEGVEGLMSAKFSTGARIYSRP
jgi:hypothetical protein